MRSESSETKLETEIAPSSESDLDNSGDEPKKPSQQIMRHELKEALTALERPSGRLFFSGLSAGLEIGFSLFLMAAIQTLVQDELPHAISTLLIANTYSFGFILVILGRSELFTEQTSLAVLPVLSGRATVKGLLRLWAIVYVANIIGAAAFAGLVTQIGPSIGVIKPQVFTEIAQGLVRHPPQTILLSGILAGWLMGLLSWLVAAGRDTISQIVIVWLVTTTIGIGHLHHSIVGTVEVLAGVFTSNETSWSDFGHFLLWATLGNAIGGPVFLALLKHTHARADDGR